MKKVYIIAEAGVNHNGDIALAKQLVDVAKKAQVDAVKFQTSIPELGVSRFAPKAEYQNKNVEGNESQLEMVKKLALSFDEFTELKTYCDTLGIEFLSTPFDFPSIDFLESLDVRAYKVPSGEVTNLPYLIKIGKLKRPVILSTGMSNLDEVTTAVKILREHGTEDITVLHCTTEYPTPYSDVNLNAMLTLKETLQLPVGYSDHTLGIEVPIAAVAMGATVIEKHFTLDKTMKGPDHKASLEPDELIAMVKAIRNIEESLGDGQKIAASSEVKNMDIARKSIIAKTSIKRGELLTEENLTVKRPGNGISPMKWFEVIGRMAVRDFDEDEMIEL